jgi:hypothetical protein
MSRPTKEFQAFTSLTDKLLAVSKATIHERHQAHKEQAAQNPRKRGPKPRVKPPSATDPAKEPDA